jgi:hypothetical protein
MNVLRPLTDEEYSLLLAVAMELVHWDMMWGYNIECKPIPLQTLQWLVDRGLIKTKAFSSVAIITELGKTYL